MSYPEAVAAFIALSAAGFAVRRAPRVFAPLAFLPVGRPVTVPIPPETAALWMSRQERAVTYRSAGSEELGLAHLPGQAVVTYDDYRLHFFPDRGSVAATKRGFWSGSLVRVDVRPMQGALLLRARYVSSTFLWMAALALIVRHGLNPQNILVAGGCFVGFLLGFIREEEDARRCLDGIALELKRRLVEMGKDSAPSAAG
jgi:hypothetical protein